MVSLLLFASVAVVLAGAGAFAVLSTFEASRMITEGQETRSQLDQIEAVLVSQMVSAGSDGRPNLPAGPVSDVGGFMLLPTGLGLNRFTAAGQPIAYCPLGDNAPSLANPINVFGSNYQVETVSNDVTGGQAYVVKHSLAVDGDTAAALANVSALLIAPGSAVEQADIRCDRIEYECLEVDEGSGACLRDRFILPPPDGSDGGRGTRNLVRAISAQGLSAVQNAIASSEMDLVTSTDAACSTPDSCGGGTVNGNIGWDLHSALDAWEQARPRQARIEVSRSTDLYANDSDRPIDFNGTTYANDGTPAQVRIIGADTAPTITMPAATSTPARDELAGVGMALPADVYLDTLTFAGGARFGIETGRRAEIVDTVFQSGLSVLPGARALLDDSEVSDSAALIVGSDARVLVRATDTALTFSDVTVRGGGVIQFLGDGAAITVDSLTAHSGARVVFHAAQSNVTAASVTGFGAHISAISAGGTASIGAAFDGTAPDGAAPDGLNDTTLIVEGAVTGDNFVNVSGGRVTVMPGAAFDLGSRNMSADGGAVISVIGSLRLNRVDLSAARLALASTGRLENTDIADGADPLLNMTDGAELAASSGATIGDSISRPIRAVVIDSASRIRGPSVGVTLYQDSCATGNQATAVALPDLVASDQNYLPPSGEWATLSSGRVDGCSVDADPATTNIQEPTIACGMQWLSVVGDNLSTLQQGDDSMLRLADWCVPSS